MVGGASVYKSKEETNKFMEGVALVSSSVHYQISPELASEQFRYYVATNQENHEVVLYFFNLMNDNKFVKEGAKIILDSIKTNMKIYVPMIAPQFTMEESLTYDSMTDQKFEQLRQERQPEVLRDQNVHFHSDEA